MSLSQSDTPLELTGMPRAFAFGAAGLAGEVIFTAIADFIRGRDRRLIGRSSLWMLPLYGVMPSIFEPGSRWMRRNLPISARLPLYGLGFLAAERLSAEAIKKLNGEVPWDYAHSKWSRCGGTIRLDYLPIWMFLGLAMEHLVDREKEASIVSPSIQESGPLLEEAFGSARPQ